MLGRNIKSAMAGLRASKWRSLMTMTGIIIGIVSVVTTVSLGEGIKQQVVGQVNHQGSDLLTVRPGNLVSRDKYGTITHVNIASSFLGTGLSDADLATVQKTEGVKTVVPISIVGTGAKNGDQEYNEGVVIGTNESYLNVVNQKLAYGIFFSKEEDDRQVAVIGKHVAEQLFHENVPIGMTVTIHGQDFIVRGILDNVNSTSPFGLGPDYNNSILVPYLAGKAIANGSSQINEILVRVSDGSRINQIADELTKNIRNAHGNQNDFTVLRQNENIALTSSILNLFTGFIAGIAAISLLVGGIGIMNIMLVSVTERTREIGIRKAVGATNRQIRSQFLTEATVLSVVGGIIGILVAIVINLLLRIFTHLNPIISLPVILVATAVSLGTGIIFGLMPAMRAARKDPIEALRYE